MLKLLVPNLMVENVQETVDWYSSVLGFQLETEVPGDSGPVFAIVRSGGVTLMFQLRASLEEDLSVLNGVPIAASQTFYIEVDEVDALRQRLEGKVRVVKDLHDTFYGAREFYFTDLNGYILCFSQSIS